MRRYLWVAVLALTFLVVSLAGSAWADGTETLGPPSGLTLTRGSGVAYGGTGLFTQPGNFTVTVPQTATVKQVIAYWEGHATEPQTGDETVVLNGTEVLGTRIGGPTHFFNSNRDGKPVFSTSYRADVTSLNLIRPGANPVTASGLTFNFANNGVGLVAIYDTGTPADIQFLDGNDLAYFEFAPPLDTTVPQTFTFAPSDQNRTGALDIFVGSVGISRPNSIAVTVQGVTRKHVDLLKSGEGREWDAVSIPVDVPAGATSATVQLLSERDATDRQPASMSWVVGSFSVPSAPPPAAPIALAVDKTNDADRNATFSDRETAPAQGSDVVFRVQLTNPNPVDVAIDRLVDTFAANSVDLLAGNAQGTAKLGPSTCASLSGAVIKAKSGTLATGGPASCTFTLQGYSPAAGPALDDLVQARVHEVTRPDNVATAIDASSVLSPQPVPPTTTPNPTIDVVKTATVPPDAQGLKTVVFRENAGPQSVDYVYVVTNTGNVPLTNVTLVDDVLGTVPLAQTTLAPGQSTTGRATYQVKGSDATAGRIVNHAVASGIAPDNRRVQDTSDETVRVTRVAQPTEVLPLTIVAPPAEPAAPEPAPAEVQAAQLPATGAGVGLAGTTAGGLVLLGLVVLQLAHGLRRRDPLLEGVWEPSPRQRLATGSAWEPYVFGTHATSRLLLGKDNPSGYGR